MKSLLPFLLILAALSREAATAQMPTGLSTNDMAKAQARAAAMGIVPAPPPQLFTIAAAPVASHVWQSQDLKHWFDSGTNTIVFTNSAGNPPQFYRAAFYPQAVVTWLTQTTNVGGYNIYEWADAFPPGAYLTWPVGVTNTAVMPLLAAGNNHFRMEQFDGFGNVSELSTVATMATTNPVITLTRTNAP